MTGLHAYKLNIKRITVDGQETTFELRPYPEENLPENVLEGVHFFSCFPPYALFLSHWQPPASDLEEVGHHRRMDSRKPCMRGAYRR